MRRLVPGVVGGAVVEVNADGAEGELNGVGFARQHHLRIRA